MGRQLSLPWQCLLIVALTSTFSDLREPVGRSSGFMVTATEEQPLDLKIAKLINEKVYSNVFVRKREEHKLLVNHLRTTEEYSKRYKLLQMALDEIIRIIREDGAKLRGNRITAESEFPKLPELIESLAKFLENTCLFGELVLHFPDMTNRVLKSVKDWRELITKALNYAQSFEKILDDQSIELLSLLNQEVNEDQRSEDYVNPYREENQPPKEPVAKKKKTKPKKGPSLSAPKTEL